MKSTANAWPPGVVIGLVGGVGVVGLLGLALWTAVETSSPPTVVLTAWHKPTTEASLTETTERLAEPEDLLLAPSRLEEILADAEAEARRYSDQLAAARQNPSRISLPGSENAPADDPSDRWTVYIPEGISLDEYARLLDHHGIELGVLQPGGRVAYARAFAGDRPDAREGPANNERRLYLSWTRGELVEADRTLLALADIESGDRPILHFLPQAVERDLARLETEFEGLTPSQIARTQFGLRIEDGAWTFFVLEQTARQ